MSVAELYGFAAECRAKYGDGVLSLFGKLFSALPVCAIISSKVMVVHGGLWRKPGCDDRRIEVGCLDDLSHIDRFGKGDAIGSDPVSDALWSDPRQTPGAQVNATRGIGIEFGPDCALEFLKAHNLRMMIRAHEGPDARDKRPSMPHIDRGFSTDIFWDHGDDAPAVVTVFSAPEYPQFRPPTWQENRHTSGALVRISLAECKPEFVVLEAVPHPPGMRFATSRF